MDNTFEPQNTPDPQLVRQATALASTLHADVLVMDQSGRALLRAACREADQARRPQVGQSSDRGHRGVHPTAQLRPKTPALDQVSRRHSGVHRTLLPPHPGRPCAKWVVTSESGHWWLINTCPVHAGGRPVAQLLASRLACALQLARNSVVVRWNDLIAHSEHGLPHRRPRAARAFSSTTSGGSGRQGLRDRRGWFGSLRQIRRHGSLETHQVVEEMLLQRLDRLRPGIGFIGHLASASIRRQGPPSIPHLWRPACLPLSA